MIFALLLIFIMLQLSHVVNVNGMALGSSFLRVPIKLFAHTRKRRMGSTTPATPVRVRFAPSPTGSLHVGGARTALFNWLLARKTNGTFVVRVEDTDLARSTRASEQSILNDLKWLQMDWDEGPDVGGAFGPYRQSERQHIYKKHAEELIEKGFAYRCFCTEEELEKQKVDAAGQGLQNVGYLGTWRDADPEEVSKRLKRGDPYAIRFKVPPNKIIVLRDMVRGLVTWNGDATLGDFVIMRSNGMPVYNFCVAVDDYLMNITHVIRAEEHLSNTPKQLLVLEALGCTTPPTYAHCSLILASDRSKLSKRHGATSVNEFRLQSFSSNSMINYLCNLGWNSGLKKEIFQPAELIKLFDMSRIIPSSAVFDMRKLRWVNAQHLHMLPPEEYLETILSSLRKCSNGDSKPLLKYQISAKPEAKNESETETETEIKHTSDLPPYHGTEEKKQSFFTALLNILRKDMQLSNDSNDLLREYITYPLFDTITGTDTRPLEIVEDYYEQFVQIAKIVLRDYNEMRRGTVATDKIRFPNGSEADMEEYWKKYVAQVAEELNSTAGMSDVPIKNNIIMMSLRLLLTGRRKGPNVGQLIALLHYSEEFLNPEGESYVLVPMEVRMKKIHELLMQIERTCASADSGNDCQ